MKVTVKQLVKSRNLKFLHPTVVKSANEAEVATILKAVAYFRNFSIFKALYTVLYKNKALTIDHFADIFKTISEYKAMHPNDYFVEGFSKALAKSNAIGNEVKTVYGIMIYNHLYKDALFDRFIPRYGKKLQRAIAQYYDTQKSINVAVIRKAKVQKINEQNIVKSIIKWNRL